MGDSGPTLISHTVVCACDLATQHQPPGVERVETCSGGRVMQKSVKPTGVPFVGRKRVKPFLGREGLNIVFRKS